MSVNIFRESSYICPNPTLSIVWSQKYANTLNEERTQSFQIKQYFGHRLPVFDITC